MTMHFLFQGSRVQISESHIHSRQGFSTSTAADTTTDAYTLRQSGNYPPTSE